ncbi:hypothetical protein KFU94_69205 [Chloroflexi bacterium TSY]|nr:hypothetical protein [Chloroflexi bacterium TSY]
MNRIYLTIVLLSLLVTSACVPLEPAAVSASSTSGSTLHELIITATAEGWDTPESVPAGWTEVTVINESDGRRQAAFLRLDDDKTMDDVFAAIEAGMRGHAEWMTAYGGVSGVQPGTSRTVTVNLSAGQYIVIDPVPGADGVPGMAKGYFMPLIVEESDAETAPPTADMAIELVDYAFIFDYEAVTAGSHTIQVINSGPQEAHEVIFIKLNKGATVQDFLAALAPDAPEGPPPGRSVAGTAAFDTVTQNYLEVEFEAGATYGLVCFLPSTQQDGQRHHMLGMVGQFTVPG